MRKLLRTFGVIALAAVIGFSMTACPEPEDEGGPTTFGDKLEFSGEQVYVVEESDDYTVKYKPYTGADVTFASVFEAVPKIVGGKFSFSIGEPASQYLEGIEKMFSSDYEDEAMYTDLNISDSTAKFATIHEFETANSRIYMNRGNAVYNNIKTSGEEIISGSMTSESVMFVYVDKPVKITGKGRTETGTEDGQSYSYKNNDLNLSLSKGWNTVCTRSVYSLSSSGYSSTYTISVSNPSSLKWVLYDYSY